MDRHPTNLIGVNDDLALLLVTAGDEQQVVERRRVVQDPVVLKRVQDVPAPEFEEVNPALIDRQPESLRPV